MKILVAPLNWGLGHAARCVPLIRKWLNEGHEVVLGGDGDSLTLLRKSFPRLRYVYLAPLNMRYSKGNSQVWAIIRSLPQLIRWSIQDHHMLDAVLREEMFDRVVSDNRFDLYSRKTECIYITHQLHIRLPKAWRWAEPLVSRWHTRIWRNYNQVWIPDYEQEQQSLSGWLGHGVTDKRIRYIGPQSRLSVTKHPRNTYGIVAVLSGVEPQRSMLEAEIAERYKNSEQSVLIVQGLVGRPMTRIKRGNITIAPYLNDAELSQALLEAEHIIARSGYSTIMDLDALGILHKAELIPTPGQSEQEYLAEWLQQRTN